MCAPGATVRFSLHSHCSQKYTTCSSSSRKHSRVQQSEVATGHRHLLPELWPTLPISIGWGEWGTGMRHARGQRTHCCHSVYLIMMNYPTMPCGRANVRRVVRCAALKAWHAAAAAASWSTSRTLQYFYLPTLLSKRDNEDGNVCATRASEGASGEVPRQGSQRTNLEHRTCNTDRRRRAGGTESRRR